MWNTRHRLLLQVNKTPFVSDRLFSSSVAASRRIATYLNDASDNTDAESTVYKRALKLQRPTTIRYQENLNNFVSLIGVIDFPFKDYSHSASGGHAILRVRAPDRPYHSFRILLQFLGEMAEVSAQHLKPRDLVYVSGRLLSYVKSGEEGSSVRYKVDVKEMNFVAENNSTLASKHLVNLEPKVSFEDIMQKRRNRLHLWHLFFANPDEWWDNRKSKLKPESPDFKHKDTGEVLWLTQSDPPWINKQLELHDSRSSKRSHVDQRKVWSHLSPLAYDEVKSN